MQSSDFENSLGIVDFYVIPLKLEGIDRCMRLLSYEGDILGIQMVATREDKSYNQLFSSWHLTLTLSLTGALVC